MPSQLDLDAIRARTEALDIGDWMDRWSDSYMDALELSQADVPALLAEVNRLNTVVAAVRELHAPVDGYYAGDQFCEQCEIRYPCPTISSLGGVS